MDRVCVGVCVCGQCVCVCGGGGWIRDVPGVCVCVCVWEGGGQRVCGGRLGQRVYKCVLESLCL